MWVLHVVECSAISGPEVNLKLLLPKMCTTIELVKWWCVLFYNKSLLVVFVSLSFRKWCSVWTIFVRYLKYYYCHVQSTVHTIYLLCWKCYLCHIQDIVCVRVSLVDISYKSSMCLSSSKYSLHYVYIKNVSSCSKYRLHHV